MYTIGQVSKATGLPVSTLRYYDKEGLFPHLERKGYVRKFSDTELEEVKIIECLKRSGLEIKYIRQFFQWVSEGSNTYEKRRELFANQKKSFNKKSNHLKKQWPCSNSSAGTMTRLFKTGTRMNCARCCRTICRKRFKKSMTRPISNAGYGQNGVFWDLPVNGRPRLRAKWRLLRFARKWQTSVTGKMAFIGICP